ncbi:unnamed protein product [Chrysoparadoxa australica]
MRVYGGSLGEPIRSMTAGAYAVPQGGQDQPEPQHDASGANFDIHKDDHLAQAKERALRAKSADCSPKSPKLSKQPTGLFQRQPTSPQGKLSPSPDGARVGFEDIEEGGSGGSPRSAPAKKAAIDVDDAREFETLDFSYAFWFGMPSLFKLCLDAQLLFNCVYLALFGTRFCALAASEYSHGEGGAMIFFMLLPTLGRMIFLGPDVFQSYSLLLSVSQIQAFVLDETLENMMNDTRELRTQVALAFREELQDVGRAGLHALYTSLDLDKNGRLTQEEFSHALSHKGVTFSAHQMRVLFHLFNPDGTSLHYGHFCELLYPTVEHWSVDSELMLHS